MTHQVTITFTSSETNPYEEFSTDINIAVPEVDRPSTLAEQVAAAVANAMHYPEVVNGLLHLLDVAMAAKDAEEADV
jgi:hypothetical protein